jgi:lysophospholipase L1-like esterase
VSARTRTSRIRRLLGTLALVLASVVVTLLVLEIGFRLAHVSVGTVQINRATVRKSANPRLRFELRPDSAVEAEVEYRINAEGLRGPPVALEKAEGVRRVAVLGDSVAFGYWVAEEDAFPRQLEGMLNAVRDGGPRVEVLNFGVPGYNLDQEIETLRSRVLAFAPDVVVVAFCLNDLEGIFSYELGLVQDRSARRRALLGRLREGLLSRSVFLAWVEYRLAEADARRRFVRARNPSSGPLYEQAVSQQKEVLLGKLGVLHAIVDSHGIAGVVVVFPAFGGDWERYPYGDLHRVVAEAAEESGLLSLDLLDCYSAYFFRDVRVDVVHPNPMGHRVAAHAIRDLLCARGILCPAPPAEGPTCRDYRKEDFPTVRGY